MLVDLELLMTILYWKRPSLEGRRTAYSCNNDEKVKTI